MRFRPLLVYDIGKRLGKRLSTILHSGGKLVRGKGVQLNPVCWEITVCNRVKLIFFWLYIDCWTPFSHFANLPLLRGRKSCFSSKFKSQLWHSSVSESYYINFWLCAPAFLLLTKKEMYGSINMIKFPLKNHCQFYCWLRFK